MIVHLVKLCAGAESLKDLEDRVRRGTKACEKAGRGRVHEHVTRMCPRRDAELLDGGSIYWVIKGVVLVRQRLLGLEKRTGEDGIDRCAIMIDPELVLTEPQPRRAFQGWRYLPAEDAPKDLKQRSRNRPPPELNMQLAELGLL